MQEVSKKTLQKAGLQKLNLVRIDEKSRMGLHHNEAI
jgi:hypothetical protein